MSKKNLTLTFQFIANACGIFTGKNGTRILCDPWLVDGVFDGSWCHYPKLETKVNDVINVDAVYVSHLHPDHFDERYFCFAKDKPIIVLDHSPNFLIKKLETLGFTKLIKIKNGETIDFFEFRLTMFAPFAKHNFHEAKIGNLIDSALLIDCDGVKAFNANDNTPTVETSEMISNKYGPISLAMLNYNSAGPYPSCFDNLSELEKVSESNRILERNFRHMKKLIYAMRPKYVLPFAGAYVLGGKLREKNNYLGTTTWDKCADWLNSENIKPTEVVLLRENDILNVETGTANKKYLPLDDVEMTNYIENDLSRIKFPYELDCIPNEKLLIADIECAVSKMQQRMDKFGFNVTSHIILEIFDKKYQIYPKFGISIENQIFNKKLECKMDERLLRRILDRKSHWNNAEIGAHISFKRFPNEYDPDLHTALQFFHL